VSPAIVLDAGALIALDRNDRETWAMLRVAAEAGSVILVPAGAIGQAWRDGKRQALLTRALRHCDELAFDGLIARAAGLLCGQTGTADVIDATVALAAAAAARAGDAVLVTSDLDDMERLTSALAARLRIEIV